MTTTIITKPLVQPVTLSQIKQHLRIDHDADDDYLVELSEAATLHVEAYSSHSLINRTLRQYIDELPAEKCIVLDAWPVSEIMTVTGFDAEGDPHVLPLAAYKLQQSNKAIALLITSEADLAHLSNGLEVDFIAGHGESGLDVPSNITRAILVLIAHWYEVRGATAAGIETALIPDGVNKLLAPIRRVRL